MNICPLPINISSSIIQTRNILESGYSSNSAVYKKTNNLKQGTNKND